MSVIPDGWVDIQVNGFMGVDFSRPGLTVADVRRVTQELVRCCTAVYCPTIITSQLSVYEANLPVLAAAMDEPDLRPHLPGIHLEGPFLAVEARGAHRLDLLRRPDTALLDRWLELARGQVRMLTLAPELDGAEAVIRRAVSRGVVVSLGHHVGDHQAIARAAEAGATSCTHLGNGIPNMLPRHPNPIWTQLAEDRLCAMLITDGHHLPAEFVRVALRAKGLNRIVVTSDMVALAGLPPGDYEWEGTAVVKEPSGRIVLKNSFSLAGSSATMAECMDWLRNTAGLTETECRQVGRTNPLRLLGKA